MGRGRLVLHGKNQLIFLHSCLLSHDRASWFWPWLSRRRPARLGQGQIGAKTRGPLLWPPQNTGRPAGPNAKRGLYLQSSPGRRPGCRYLCPATRALLFTDDRRRI